MFVYFSQKNGFFSNINNIRLWYFISVKSFSFYLCLHSCDQLFPQSLTFVLLLYHHQHPYKGLNKEQLNERLKRSWAWSTVNGFVIICSRFKAELPASLY